MKAATKTERVANLKNTIANNFKRRHQNNVMPGQKSIQFARIAVHMCVETLRAILHKTNEAASDGGQGRKPVRQ